MLNQGLMDPAKQEPTLRHENHAKLTPVKSVLNALLSRHEKLAKLTPIKSVLNGLLFKQQMAYPSEISALLAQIK